MAEPLVTDIDTGPNFTVPAVLCWSDCIQKSAVFPMFLQVYAQGMLDNQLDYNLQWSRETQAVYVTADLQIIGFIAYNVHRGLHNVEVLVLWVLPNYRERGIYRMMRTEVERRAVLAGCSELRVRITPDDPAVHALQADGFVIHSIRYVRHITGQPK